MIHDFITSYWHSLLLVLSVFTVGAASPGPTILMILNAGITQGRRQALCFSMGVTAGSLVWAVVVAAFSVTAIQASVTIILIMKLSAGCYLFYLSAKSFRSARSPHSALESQRSLPYSATQLSLEGFLVHLTNPKVPLVWLAAYSVGSSATTHPLFFSIVIGFCALIAFTIYAGYAFLFSTSIALKTYIAVRRPFEFLISALFGSAALAMLLFRHAPQ